MPAEMPYIPAPEAPKYRGLLIKEVLPGGIGQELGLREGDKLIEINGQALRDQIDASFWENADLLELLVEREDGSTLQLRVDKDEEEALGLVFEPIRFRRCANKCVFCFIDQNRPGSRETLFFKDEDYRLSFLHGNYVTLTNLKPKDMERILEQRLSPLFVSVHSLDPARREILLGAKERRPFRELLETLLDGGITVHGQVVCCPGLNDGEDLRRTIDGLGAYFPEVGSLSVVPVGLTRFREGLYQLDPFTKQTAADVLDIIHERAEHYRALHGEAFVYASDEFYLLAERPLPGLEFYDRMPQLSNGVGLMTKFVAEWEEHLDLLREYLAEQPLDPQHLAQQPTIVTGGYAGPFLEGLIHQVQQLAPQVQLRLVEVRNDYFGERIKVVGLLTGKDILAALRGVDLGEGPVLLPYTVLNSSRSRFLDNMSCEEFEAQLGRSVQFLEPEAEPLFLALTGMPELVW